MYQNQPVEQNYYEFLPRIADLVKWYETAAGKRNEANTRLHIIDQLIFKCLGWSIDNVSAEDREDGKIADYTFTLGKRILIIEAKREGQLFSIPAGRAKQLEHKLSGLIHDNPALKEAVEQAAQYAQGRGVGLAGVCNGTQLVLFVASRDDGKNVFEGRCLVFDSLERMRDNFRSLWDSISPDALLERRLVRKLMGDLLPVIPPKLSSRIPNYPGVMRRNVVQVELQMLSEQILEDIPNDESLEDLFIEECYCQSGALPKYSQLNRLFLESRYAMLFEATGVGEVQKPAATKKGIDPDIFSKSLSRRPILLLGDVGVGKSSFIKYLRKEARGSFNNAFTFYINLGFQGTLVDSLKAFVLSAIESQLRTTYNININEDGFLRATYKAEIQDFAAGVNRKLKDTNPDAYHQREILRLQDLIKDRAEFVRRSVAHAGSLQKKQVIVFIDNADQRDEPDQQAAFLIAQEIATSWNAVVYVSLRPETYELSQRVGALSGYHPRAYTISPPRVTDVVTKRIEFAIKLLQGDIPGVSFKQDDPNVALMGRVLLLFLSSIKANKELEECFENITGGNVRTALDYLKGFFSSGHIDTEKMVLEYEEESYYVPVHEFLRATIYGSNVYYSPAKSRLANAFAVQSLDGREHFLLPLFISLLSTNAVNDPAHGGFVPTTLLYEQLQSAGFLPDQIDFALQRALSKNLIEVSTRRIPLQGEPLPESVRVTSIGLYTTNVLTRSFTYVDAMIVDTSILEKQYADAISDVQALPARLKRCQIFRSYLDDRWLSFQGVKLPFNWPHQSQLLRADIEKITARLDRKR